MDRKSSDMDCKQCRGLIVDQLLGEATREEAKALDEHCASCGECRAEKEAVTAALAAYRSLAEVEASATLDDRLLALAPAQDRLRARTVRLNWWQHSVIWSAASAACLVFVVWLARHTAPSHRPPRAPIEVAMPKEKQELPEPIAWTKPEPPISTRTRIDWKSPEDIPLDLPVTMDIEDLLPDKEPYHYLVSDQELNLLAQLGVREDVNEAGLFGVSDGLLAKQTRREKENLVYTYLGHGTQAHVSYGLSWLASKQARSGAWGSGGYREGDGLSVETTALCMLAFLTDGSSHEVGVYKDNVRRAMGYLLARQSETGLFGAMGPDFMRTQSLSTLALVEAFLLTSDDSLLDPIAKAVGVILKAQRKDGGWGSNVGSGKGNTLVTAWLVMLLKEARSAGFDVPDECFSGASLWFHKATDQHGRIGHSKRGDFPGGQYRDSTAAGLLAKQLLGWPRNHISLRRAEKELGKQLPKWDRKDTADLGYLYFGTLAMFQRGGKAWEEWNQNLKDALMFRQIARGREIGSWPGARDGEHRRDRIYATAMAVLTLQVYYRYPVLSE